MGIYYKGNQLNQKLNAKGTVDFTYDSAGRLVEERQGSEILARYEYGYLDKVILVTRGNEVTKFHYNARGMLVAKERNGKIIETMAWDGIGLLAKGDTVYVNEAHVSGGVPLLSISQGENTFYDNDYLGTTTAVYNQDGETNVKLTGSLGKGTKGEDARFTGKSFDKDLGAHVFPFRNYRSDLGQWASADPSGFPDGPNQHFYAPVPTTGLDPWGLWIVEVISISAVSPADGSTFQLPDGQLTMNVLLTGLARVKVTREASDTVDTVKLKSEVGWTGNVTESITNVKIDVVGGSTELNLTVPGANRNLGIGSYFYGFRVLEQEPIVGPYGLPTSFEWVQRGLAAATFHIVDNEK